MNLKDTEKVPIELVIITDLTGKNQLIIFERRMILSL